MIIIIKTLAYVNKTFTYKFQSKTVLTNRQPQYTVYEMKHFPVNYIYPAAPPIIIFARMPNPPLYQKNSD